MTEAPSQYPGNNGAALECLEYKWQTPCRAGLGIAIGSHGGPQFWVKSKPISGAERREAWADRKTFPSARRSSHVRHFRMILFDFLRMAEALCEGLLIRV